MRLSKISNRGAQITESIYDTPAGRMHLIPQGARLIGNYDSQVAFGQSRVLPVWTRLILPNGRSIVLKRQQGALYLSAANSLNQTGQQVVHRQLNIQPTLTIKPGFPVKVIVNRDLVQQPYLG